jgi:hypothetical protein
MHAKPLKYFSFLLLYKSYSVSIRNAWEINAKKDFGKICLVRKN